MELMDNRFIQEYKNMFKRTIPLSIPTIAEDELDRALNWSIEKRFKDAEVMIHNSYKHAKVNTTLAKYVDYILDKKPIMTAYGTLFTRHGTVPNPLYDMVHGFVGRRGELKDEMFKYPKGSEMFNLYNLLQLVAKVDVNA